MLRKPPQGGIRAVSAVRLESLAVDEEICAVIEEEALTIDVRDVGTFTLMWTPTARRDQAMAYYTGDGLLGEGGLSEPLCLAAGFLFTEGVIGSLSDVVSMGFCPDNASVVSVVLADPQKAGGRRRDVVMSSSCGACGAGGRVEDWLALLEQVGSGLVVEQAQLGRLMGEMRAQQSVFEATGGAHGAAVFDASGAILALAEDLGRHNALDKVIGRCLFDHVEMGRCGVVLSSRLSLEMVAKSIRAGFQIVAAVSAPTSLAIEAAARKNQTLVGFIRQGRATVYSGSERIAELSLPTAWMN
jgi:FdhD protein